ncbi:MAG: alpha/beta hydrolase [Deltaproteobacteria bacterium]|nr:alpha/beta hydrolase [Deltaproteobacteria bacterium]
MAVVYPVIIIPGITATTLNDEYSLPAEIVWTALERKHERIALHPDDLRYEASEPALLRPGQVFEVAYKELIEELRYNLRSKEDEPVPVFAFIYDWRMPLHRVESLLDEFVGEVIQRTKLLRHYHKAGFGDDPKVNLVGHSMGGLVVTGYLEKKGKKAPVHKVATLATPYQGSFEAVIHLAAGTSNLGISSPSSREREAARITPALYHLLPCFKKALKTDPGIPESLFDPAAWQVSVIESIQEFIRLKGLTKKQRKKKAGMLFAHLLKEAEAHRERINKFTLARAGLKPDDWLAVVGVDAVTRVRLRIVKRCGRVDFDLASEDRDNKWTEEKDPRLRRLTGDGTVPFEAAVAPFLKEENLVCVTPEDYGYWEIQDKGLSRLSGFHGLLPNMDMIHRMLVRFFTDRPDPRGNTWGRRAPGAKTWRPPIEMRERL